MRERDDVERERLVLDWWELREAELFALAESSFLTVVTWAELNSSARLASTEGSRLTSIDPTLSTGTDLGLCGFDRLILIAREL